MAMKRAKITMYCTCGGKIELTFKPGTPPAKQQGAASRIFASAHTGEGHGLCDRTTAAKARERGNQRRGVLVFGDDPWL
jgi:hypothetical protein